MNTRKYRERSKGFRVIEYRTGAPMTQVFSRRDGARKALYAIMLENVCANCGAQSGKPCTRQRVTDRRQVSRRAWKLRHCASEGITEADHAW